MGKDKWWALIKVFLREETKSESSWYSLTFISDLVNLTIGLVVTLIVLGSLFSEDLRDSAMGFTETFIADGIRGRFILLFCIIIGLDSCWQFNYATFKAKGINRQWVNLIQIKYPHQKWLKPIYVGLAMSIAFTSINEDLSSYYKY
ncbi:hypothetical protein N9W15_00780 [Porticoccaceae bacterium]|jgi:membrane-anchored glycerophosphoryl diester phosphodiesterase (GDPDase)|nr:hypothetical protein [Porticoccaceae bacterium]MDA7769271.1 hypothetical protein [Porticoccaceae bacterium]MDA8941060.1 hypothetical protein [Porticoccaceae bacterium]MDB2399934.1 hypothetical protein [Porticoccaceae bacterium]MDB2558313.1 hypothetical protein [Porticoccaceae bacterium]|tara:strand:+ start:1671 stop:2108 length:438 start_codon:yes stop_codon:yes gene_type:complete